MKPRRKPNDVQDAEALKELEDLQERYAIRQQEEASFNKHGREICSVLLDEIHNKLSNYDVSEPVLSVSDISELSAALLRVGSIYRSFR